MEMFEDQFAAGTEQDAAELNRRHLLGVAGRRFALAASGLLLPAWLAQEDVEARKGAANGRLGGRRGKNRRGRDKAKRRRRAKARAKRQDQAKAPGWSLIKYVSFRFQPTSDLQDLRIDTYYRAKGQLDTWSSLKPGQTFTSFASLQTYAPERYSIAAFIQARDTTSIFVEARNPLIGTPWITVGRGGSIDANGNYVGGTYEWGVFDYSYGYFQYGLGVDDNVRLSMTPTDDTAEYVTSVARRADTSNHKVFDVWIGRGSESYVCNMNTACFV